MLRPAYHCLLNWHGRGVSIMLGGSVTVRVPPVFCGTAWENYEVSEIRAMAAWLRKQSSADFLDVGSSVGMFSVAALNASQNVRVTAFDSDLPSLMSVKRLCRYAPNRNLRVVHGYLSERHESGLTLERAGWHTAGELARSGLSGDPEAVRYRCLDAGIEEGIPVHSLDGLLKDELESARPMLIKCDVEGAEILVLRGAERLLANRSPAILLSVHDWGLARFGSSVEKLRDFLESRGYAIWLMGVDHETHWWCEKTSQKDLPSPPSIGEKPVAETSPAQARSGLEKGLHLMRKTVAFVASETGATHVLHRLLVRSAPCVATLYHRVYRRDEELGSMPMGEIRLDHLEQQLKWLRKNCVVCGLEEWLDWRVGGMRRGKPRVLVTFDDAYHDFIAHAAPLCQSLGIRPVLFVSTGFLDNRRLKPWWDYLYRGIPPAHCDFNRAFGALEKIIPHDGEDAGGAVREWAEREGWRLPVKDSPNEFCSWDELRAWSDRISIGTRGQFHLPFWEMSEVRLRKALRESVGRIEEMTGRRPIALAYPYGGKPHLTADVINAFKKEGLKAAFCMDGPFDAREMDPWRLSRCVFPPKGTANFSAHWLKMMLMGNGCPPVGG